LPVADLFALMLHVAGALVVLWLAVRIALRYRKLPMGWPLLGIATLVIIWIMGDAVYLMTTAPAVLLPWGVAVFVASILVTPLSLLLVRGFATRAPAPLAAKIAAGLFALVGLGAAVTNPWLHGILLDPLQAGALYRPLGLCSYVWVAFGLWYCLRELVRERDPLRRLQAWLLTIGILVPLASSGAYFFFGVWFRFLDSSMLAAITIVLFYLGIESADLFDFVPTGLDYLLGQTGTGFLTLDGAGRIRQCNRAAAAMLLGESEPRLLRGRLWSELVPPGAGALRRREGFTLEWGPTGDDTVRVLRVSGTPAENVMLRGWVVLLEEITEYKAMVARLQSQADELQQQHRSLQLLHAITAEMSTATSLGESLERILFLTLAGLDARTIACWAAPAPGRLRLLFSTGGPALPSPEPEAWPKLRQQGYVVDAAHGGSRLLVMIDSPHRQAPQVVQVFSDRRPYTPEDAALMLSACAEVLSAAERLSMYNQTKRLAERDALTGLYNRRHILHALEQALRTGKQPVAVAVIDVDRFKQCNDTYGHEFGDQVMRRVANAINRGLPAGALAGRYGGDEFLLLFPDTAPETVDAACRALLAAVNATQLDGGVRISLSIGVSRAGADRRSLVASADRAMYRAKAAGGGRMAWAPDQDIRFVPAKV
jgi:diguanylate cyclase (GGDEF)-like protein